MNIGQRRFHALRGVLRPSFTLLFNPASNKHHGVASPSVPTSNSAAIAELHQGAGDELHADAFPPLTRNGNVYGTRERSRSMKLGGISIKCPSSLPHKKVLHFLFSQSQNTLFRLALYSDDVFTTWPLASLILTSKKKSSSPAGSLSSNISAV